MVVDEKDLQEIVSSIDINKKIIAAHVFQILYQLILSKQNKEILLWMRGECGLQKNENEKTFMNLLLFRNDQNEKFSSLTEILMFFINEIGINQQFINNY